MNKTPHNRVWKCPIDLDLTTYGLFDEDDMLRYVSIVLEDLVIFKKELGWGEIRKIVLAKKGRKIL